MKYYQLIFRHKEDEVLYPLCRTLEEACRKSEFQFLSDACQHWKIPADQAFEFRNGYYIRNAIPIYSDQLWNILTSTSGTDGIFSIPVVMQYCGEQHFYHIAVPARIRCCDLHGRIIPEQTGRYTMFKSDQQADDHIYLHEILAERFKNHLEIQGVDHIG